MMGNPVLNREAISNYSAVYKQWGLIDSQGALAVKHLQDNLNKAIRDHDNDKAEDVSKNQ